MYTFKTISIVIPAWNESSVLSSLLNSLNKINYETKKIEIILMAGGIDNSLIIANEFNSTLFERKVVIEQLSNMGKSGAIIEGLKIAKNDIIVLLDADCIVDNDWLIELIKSLQQGYDAVSGNCYPVKKYYTATEAFKRSGYSYSINNKVATLNGMASIAFKKSIIDKYGIEYFFNRDLIANDDIYFLIKLKEKGYKVGIVVNAIIYSIYPKTFKDFLKENLRWRKAWFQLSKKIKGNLQNTLLYNILISVLPWLLLIFLSSYIFFKSTYVLIFLTLSLILISIFVIKIFETTKPLLEEDSRYSRTILGVIFLHWVDNNIIVYIVLTNTLFRTKNMGTHFKGKRILY